MPTIVKLSKDIEPRYSRRNEALAFLAFVVLVVVAVLVVRF